VCLGKKWAEIAGKTAAKLENTSVPTSRLYFKDCRTSAVTWYFIRLLLFVWRVANVYQLDPVPFQAEFARFRRWQRHKYRYHRSQTIVQSKWRSPTATWITSGLLSWTWKCIPHGKEGTRCVYVFRKKLPVWNWFSCLLLIKTKTRNRLDPQHDMQAEPSPESFQ